MFALTDSSGRRETILDAAIAHHEAGHAVAAVALRRGIQLLTITPEADWLGRMITTAPVHSEDDIDSGRLWRRQRNLLVVAAGPSAHAKYIEGSTLTVLFESSCDDDRRLMADLLIDLGRGKAKRKFVPGFGEELVIDLIEAVEETVAVADLIVGTYWSAVERLARELLEKRTLTGKQVRQIVAPHLAD